jgi:hypothetical protein
LGAGALRWTLMVILGIGKHNPARECCNSFDPQPIPAVRCSPRKQWHIPFFVCRFFPIQRMRALETDYELVEATCRDRFIEAQDQARQKVNALLRPVGAS